MSRRARMRSAIERAETEADVQPYWMRSKYTSGQTVVSKTGLAPWRVREIITACTPWHTTPCGWMRFRAGAVGSGSSCTICVESALPPKSAITTYRKRK